MSGSSARKVPRSRTDRSRSPSGVVSVPGMVLTGLMVVPPFLLALLNPGAFERSPDFAGTFGGGVFVAILPVLIAMKIRRDGAPRVFGTAGGTIVP